MTMKKSNSVEMLVPLPFLSSLARLGPARFVGFVLQSSLPALLSPKGLLIKVGLKFPTICFYRLLYSNYFMVFLPGE